MTHEQILKACPYAEMGSPTKTTVRCRKLIESLNEKRLDGAVKDWRISEGLSRCARCIAHGDHLPSVPIAKGTWLYEYRRSAFRAAVVGGDLPATRSIVPSDPEKCWNAYWADPFDGDTPVKHMREAVVYQATRTDAKSGETREQCEARLRDFAKTKSDAIGSLERIVDQVKAQGELLIERDRGRA